MYMTKDLTFIINEAKEYEDERISSVYFMLHTNNEEKGIVEANHNPYFDIDEDVLIRGVLAYISIAKKFLE